MPPTLPVGALRVNHDDAQRRRCRDGPWLGQTRRAANNAPLCPQAALVLRDNQGARRVVAAPPGHLCWLPWSSVRQK